MTHQNNCKKRQEDLMALVLDELDASAAEELRRHMRTCETCRHIYGQLIEKEERVESAFNAIAERAKDMRERLLELPVERVSPEREPGMRPSGKPGLVPIYALGKVAVAAAVIGLAYMLGRLTSPKPPDLEQFRLDVTKTTQQLLIQEVDERVQERLQVVSAELKDEFHQQVHRDLTESAAEILLVSTKLLDQRLIELAELIEAARRRERGRVVAAMEQMELARLQETHMLRSGLETLAYRTSSSQRPDMEEQ